MKSVNFQDLTIKYKEKICDISKTGPDEVHYPFLREFFAEIQHLRNNKLISEDDFLSTRDWFGGSMHTTDTIQGHICLKPYGYNGDFELIDKIYQARLSQDEINSKWDIFYNDEVAPYALRNRKDFFISVLNQLPTNSVVLNLASGPCRDLQSYAMQNDKYLEFDNIDMDSRAIEYAKKLLDNVKSIKCNFHNANILKFVPSQKYDLIWSAGLFDYFSDKLFRRLIERFADYVKPGGEIIIGNFCSTNMGIARDRMDYVDWILHYRDEDKLLSLAQNLEHFTPVIDSEPLKVNLFLRLKRR